MESCSVCYCTSASDLSLRFRPDKPGQVETAYFVLNSKISDFNYLLDGLFANPSDKKHSRERFSLLHLVQVKQIVEVK